MWKTAFLRAESFVETLQARKDEYENAAAATAKRKAKSVLELKVVSLLNEAISYVLSLHDDKEEHTKLPYGQLVTPEDRKRLGMETFKLTETTIPSRQRSNILIARALKNYGFELSPAGMEHGEALKVGKSLTCAALRAQTRGVFCFQPIIKPSPRKRSLLPSALVDPPRKLVKISQKKAAIMQTFLNSPQGKSIKEAARAAIHAAQSHPGDGDQKPDATSR